MFTLRMKPTFTAFFTGIINWTDPFFEDIDTSESGFDVRFIHYPIVFTLVGIFFEKV
jgi:hypothetical protein